jgi:hypothetical protein
MCSHKKDLLGWFSQERFIGMVLTIIDVMGTEFAKTTKRK